MRRRRGQDPESTLRVLQAVSRRKRHLDDAAGPLSPQRLLAVVASLRLTTAFARALLQKKELRHALLGHGATIKGRKWSLRHAEAAAYIAELQALPVRTTQQGRLVATYYACAEEMLLTVGKTETHRRQRALLDFYGRFVRTPAARPTTARDKRTLPSERSRVRAWFAKHLKRL